MQSPATSRQSKYKKLAQKEFPDTPPDEPEGEYRITQHIQNNVERPRN